MGRKTLLRSSILVQLAFYPTITKQTVTGYQPSISNLPGLNLLLWQHQFCMAIIRIFWISQIHHWFAKYVEAFKYQWNDITSFFALKENPLTSGLSIYWFSFRSSSLCGVWHLVNFLSFMQMKWQTMNSQIFDFFLSESYTIHTVNNDKETTVTYNKDNTDYC